MMMTSREKRNALRDRGMSLAEGVFLDDLPLMALSPTEWGDTFDRIAYKLTLALHYRFTGKPLPPSGRVWSHTHSNTDIMAESMPEMLLSMHRGGLRVDQLALDETDGEFHLGGDFWTEIGVGAYVINIRDRLFFTGMSTYDADWWSPPARDDLRGPSPPSQRV